MPIIPAARGSPDDYLAAMFLLAWAEGQGGWKRIRIETLIDVYRQIKAALAAPP